MLELVLVSSERIDRVSALGAGRAAALARIGNGYLAQAGRAASEAEDAQETVVEVDRGLAIGNGTGAILNGHGAVRIGDCQGVCVVDMRRVFFGDAGTGDIRPRACVVDAHLRGGRDELPAPRNGTVAAGSHFRRLADRQRSTPRLRYGGEKGGQTQKQVLLHYFIFPCVPARLLRVLRRCPSTIPPRPPEGNVRIASGLRTTRQIDRTRRKKTGSRRLYFSWRAFYRAREIV